MPFEPLTHQSAPSDTGTPAATAAGIVQAVVAGERTTRSVLLVR